MFRALDHDSTVGECSRGSVWIERWFPNPMFYVAKNGKR